MKNLIFIIIIFLLYSCGPCDIITIENGSLPDSVLKYVPYLDGETYSFKHSSGYIINYKASRETYDEWSRCIRCCKYEYHYEINDTKLITDYPVFNFYFHIDNLDTTRYNFSALFGEYFFDIPTKTDNSIIYYEIADSLKIDSIYYYNVFKLKSNNDDYYLQNPIYVDSLYYNYTNGILKILLSNGESYTIHN